MKFYIASSFRNIEAVRFVSKQLTMLGHIHTYDWTRNERASSLEELREIGKEEKKAVMEADLLIVMLPAGKGSHIELGIAVASSRKIFLYSPDLEVYNFETTSTFYHLTEVEIVTGTTADLLAAAVSYCEQELLIQTDL